MNEDRDLLLVAVFTTLTIVLWIFFELIKTNRTSTISAPQEQAVAPFNPKIDTEIFDVLDAHQTYD